MYAQKELGWQTRRMGRRQDGICRSVNYPLLSPAFAPTGCAAKNSKMAVSAASEAM